MIQPYSFIVGLGSSLGIAWMIWRSLNNRAAGISLHALEKLILQRTSGAILMLSGALLGSRLNYIFVHTDYYRSNLRLWITFSDGGLSWPGAVMGGALGLSLFAWGAHTSFFRLADSLIPVIVATTISAWLGCWFSNIYYGPPVSPTWWAVSIQEATGEVQAHFPLQPLAVILFTGMVQVIESNRRRFRKPGQFSSLVLFSLALELTIFSFFRKDPLMTLWGLKADTWAAIALMLATAGMFVVSSNKTFRQHSA